MTFFVDAASVHRHLEYRGLVAALQAAHASPRPFSRTMLVDAPDGGDPCFLSLVGWAPDVIAVKNVAVFPRNPTRIPPEPSAQGIVALFDATTGTPLLVADGAALTFRKTAADSALGASLLAREDAEVLLVAGAGGMGPHVALAHASIRPSIRRILIWNRTPARATSLANALKIDGVSIEATGDLDAAVAIADIISCVTMATEPLVRGALLKPGVHVDLIGSYRPEMREADDDALRRGRLFVDIRKKETRAGELLQPIQSGVLTWDDIAADLFELCSGRAEGRRSRDEITIYKNLGGGHLDLFTIRYLWERVRQSGEKSP